MKYICIVVACVALAGYASAAVHSRSVGDNKENLLHRAESIHKSAEEAIKLLDSQNKKHQAENLEKDVALLEKLVAELKETTDHHKLAHLEAELSTLERRMTSEIHRIHSNSNSEHREKLLKKAEHLEKASKEAIKYLEAHNRTHEAEVIIKDDQRLEKLTEELKKATTPEDLHHLEKEVNEIEHRLENELRRIYHHHQEVESDFIVTDRKEYLLKNAELLLNATQKALTFLNENNRTHESQELVKQEEVLKKLVKELEETTDHHHLNHLENQINELEHLISAELRRIYYEKSLLEKAEELLANIKEEIKKLESEGHGEWTKNLVQLEKHTEKLVEEIKHSKSNIHDETILTIEYNRVRNHFDLEVAALKRDAQSVEILQKRAQALYDELNKDIELLEKNNYTETAEILKIDSERLHLVIKELKNETELGPLRYLEAQIRYFEFSIETKLHKIERELNENPHHDQFYAAVDGDNDLVNKYHDLLNKVQKAIKKLEDEGKKELAVGLEGIEKFLLDLDTQIHNINPHTILGQEAIKILEALLEKEEQLLEDELKKLGKN